MRTQRNGLENKLRLRNVRLEGNLDGVDIREAVPFPHPRGALQNSSDEYFFIPSTSQILISLKRDALTSNLYFIRKMRNPCRRKANVLTSSGL